MNKEPILIGCVAENNPKYLDQALRLLQSVRWFGGSLRAARFVVCVVERVDSLYLKRFEALGAEVRLVDRLSRMHPQSNKLRFLELEEASDSDRVVLLDCDTIVVKDPSPFFRTSDFQAKIADAPTVSHKTFQRLFSTFGLSMPSRDQKCTVHGEATIAYFNAGVLVFSKTAMEKLVPAWMDLNNRLIDRLVLLQDERNFCEQASLSLALVETKTNYSIFGNEMNFPAHFRDAPVMSEFYRIDPAIIHYHWLVSDDGYLLPSPYPKVNSRIEQFNSRLREERGEGFNNQAYWNIRYRENPELGSGLGSRGYVAEYKKGLLRHCVLGQEISSILDIGCGDMAVGRTLPEKGYIGIDISDVVIRDNMEKFPSRQFLNGDFITLDPPSAHLVVCLDVLIHLSDRAHYERFVQALVQKTEKMCLVAGYEEPPSKVDVTFFHEPLSKTLQRAGARNFHEIGAYRQVRVFRFGNASRPEIEEYNSAEFERPLFIVGTMRSGTTLLAKLLDLSPDICYCPFELKDVWSTVGGISMASAKTGERICPALGADDVRPGQALHLAEAFAKRMRGREKRVGSIFLNKNPHLSNKLPFVSALFPDARFIWIRRHLLQVVASMKRLFIDVRQRQDVQHYWPESGRLPYARCWEVFRDGVADRTFPGGNVQYLAEYWLEANSAIMRHVKEIPTKFHFVQQENIVHDPSVEITRCEAFLELPLRLPDKTPELDPRRNEEWRSLLTDEEVDSLRCFVEANAIAINDLFSGCDQSALYLEQLGVNGAP